MCVSVSLFLIFPLILQGERGRVLMLVGSFSGYIYLILAAALQEWGSWKKIRGLRPCRTRDVYVLLYAAAVFYRYEQYITHAQHGGRTFLPPCYRRGADTQTHRVVVAFRRECETGKMCAKRTTMH
uniref:Uncharacterized protein n=1 Tax=Amblyomma americanum TaxID=6943 RepID=A0A0C9SEW6_AMBAM